MERISGEERHYAWGSRTALPNLLGDEPAAEPLAEIWFGAHVLAPSSLTASGVPLNSFISQDPIATMGETTVARFGQHLPYLLKLISAAKPLSLQVHPSKERAEAQFAREEAAGIALSDPARVYKDANHKPELIYALSDFEALAGFRAPRRALEIFDRIQTPLAQWICSVLRAQPGPAGIKRAVSGILDQVQGPTPEQVEEIVAACRERLADGTTPSVRADKIVLSLAESYPGDPGIVVSALMNPVTLHPGEALFIPAGGLHAYLSGTGVEIMACSDNVLRAGLTDKYLDVEELLNCLDYVAAPPVRIAPERFDAHTAFYYAPVDDFELAVCNVQGPEVHLPGRGGRILLVTDGQVALRDARGITFQLTAGEAVFVRAEDGKVFASGQGCVMQAAVP